MRLYLVLLTWILLPGRVTMTAYLLFPLLLLVTIGLNTLGQTWLKLGADQTPPQSFYYLVMGLTAYGLSTVSYVKVLSKFNLSFAYPLVIGLTIVATTLSGVFFLREKVVLTQWLGIGLVLSGISAIALARPA